MKLLVLFGLIAAIQGYCLFNACCQGTGDPAACLIVWFMAECTSSTMCATPYFHPLFPGFVANCATGKRKRDLLNVTTAKRATYTTFESSLSLDSAVSSYSISYSLQAVKVGDDIQLKSWAKPGGPWSSKGDYGDGTLAARGFQPGGSKSTTDVTDPDPNSYSHWKKAEDFLKAEVAVVGAKPGQCSADGKGNTGSVKSFVNSGIQFQGTTRVSSKARFPSDGYIKKTAAFEAELGIAKRDEEQLAYSTSTTKYSSFSIDTIANVKSRIKSYLETYTKGQLEAGDQALRNYYGRYGPPPFECKCEACTTTCSSPP